MIVRRLREMPIMSDVTGLIWTIFPMQVTMQELDLRPLGQVSFKEDHESHNSTWETGRSGRFDFAERTDISRKRLDGSIINLKIPYFVHHNNKDLLSTNILFR